MIVDVHSHVHQPEHRSKKFNHDDVWRKQYGKDHVDRTTPAMFDEAMQRAGVDVAILFGVTIYGDGAHTPNSFVEQYSQQLKTPNVKFAAVDPLDPDCFNQIDEAVELGFRGVKLYPVLAQFDPLDSAFTPFFQKLEQHSLVTLWHMGATPYAHGRLALTQPLLIDEVARRHPELKQVMAHMGHPWQRDTNIVLRKHPNVYADVSASWVRTMDGFLAFVHAQEWGTTGKLLFGSDFPIYDPETAIKSLRKIATMRAGDLPYVEEETIEGIIHRDSLSLLEIPDPRNQ